MLTIRSAQEQELLEVANRRLVERVGVLLQDVFPLRCAELSLAQLHAAIARRLELGRRVGLVNEDDLARLNLLLFAATPHAAQDSEPDWALALLGDASLDPDSRLALLRRRTHEEVG